MSSRFPHFNRIYRFLFALVILASLAFYPWPGRAANGVVGDGNAASCTEEAFNTVFNAVESSGGGTITFDCGAAPLALIFTFYKAVSADTELDGGDLITLSGGNATSLFQVYGGKTFTLRHITLAHGYGTFGGVENFGHLIVQDSQLLNNAALNSGGAISNYGELNLTNALLANNTAGQFGGGINLESGTATIEDSQFTENSAFTGGGGIYATAGVTVTIDNSQFSGNQVTDTFAEGGAILTGGTLTITHTTLFQNHGSRGGGLYIADGSTSIASSWFTGNYSAYGGGIRQSAGKLVATDVSFAHNGYAPNGSQVNTGGGALSWGDGIATLTNVTIRDNWASYGGGFDHDLGTTTLTNVTLSGNSAVGGGAIDQGGGVIDLINTTIADNAAQFFAGGISNRGGTIALKNTLLSGNYNPSNSQPFNCYKPVPSSSFSLSSDYTCSFGTGRDGVSLLLGPLANNGGFNQTHLLLRDNPAIDGGTSVGCPPTDERGVTRPQGQACDVGAVEITPADLLSKAYLPLLRR